MVDDACRRPRRAATSFDRGAGAERSVESGRASSEGPQALWASGRAADRTVSGANMFAAVEALVRGF